MKHYLAPVINFLKKEDGPTAVECALMLGLVIVICVVAINSGSAAKATTIDQGIVLETVETK